MTAIRPIRVAIVDAQAIFRAGIRQIVAAFPDIAVIGEASCSLDAFTLCERLRPDVLLFDASMPGGLTLIARLYERGSSVHVVILTDHVDATLLSHGIKLGITGYLLKQIEAFDFIQALRSAASGLLTIAAEVPAAAISQIGLSEHHPDRLSGREQAVVDLLLQGLSNRAIAAQLHLSCATVKFHLRNVYEKLGVRTRSEAIAIFYQQRHTSAEPEQLPGRPGRRTLAVAS